MKYKRPVCKYCNNKLKSEVYIWVEYESALIHKQCIRIQKRMYNLKPGDNIVHLGPIRMGVKEGM